MRKRGIMREHTLFDTDDFEQSPRLFAKILASIFRMRGRHGHLVAPAAATLKLLLKEGLYPEGGEKLRELKRLVSSLEGKKTNKSRKTDKGKKDVHLPRAQVVSKLIVNLDELASSGLDKPKVVMLRGNLERLGRVVRLDPVDIDILFYRIMCDLNPAFSRLADRMNEALAGVYETFACLLPGDPDQIRAHLLPSARLCNSGLIRIDVKDRDFSDSIDVLEKLSHLSFQTIESDLELQTLLVGSPKEATLAPGDYPHVKKDLVLMTNIVKNAVKSGEKGMNILFYGPPGTGKTELSKVVAKQAGLDLYFVGECDEDGEEPSRYERIGELSLSQTLLKDSAKPGICCFDEAEDIFDSGFSMSRQRPNSKVFMNRFFENNPVPIIWIVNELRAIPYTLRRRMSFALKLDNPPVEVSTGILLKMADKAGFTIGDERAKSLSQTPNMSPGLFAKAVQATQIAGGEVGIFDRIVEGLLQAQNGGNPVRPPLKSLETFDPALSNATIDLSEFQERLTRSWKKKNSFSLCLYGASGTGKSAFAMHLAKQLGMETLHLKGSDIFGMYVGQTEANIAAAFENAIHNDLFLIMDEVDALLWDRRGAQRSFEVSQVNELLQAMEHHPLPFACTTNLNDQMDKASMRRFTFRIEFEPLGAVQLERCYQTFFKHAPPASVREFVGLTPADFAVVQRQARILGCEKDQGKLVAMLVQMAKDKGIQARPIGFQPGRTAPDQHARLKDQPKKGDIAAVRKF